MRQPRKFILIALVAVSMLMLLTVMSGCRPSDALKEIVFNQNSDIVDYDNEQKFYINNEDAEVENPLVPSEETTDTDEETDEKQNIVVYSSDPNSPDFTAKQSLWSITPDFTGIEASSKVKFYQSDDPTAVKQKLQNDDDSDDSEDDNDTALTVEDGTEFDDEKEGTAESDTSSNLEASDSGKGGNNSNQEGDPKAAEATSNPAGNVTSDLTSNFVDPPHVNTIAATGDLAVLVQIIGGNGALAAADNSLLSSKFKSVCSISGVKTGWSDGGTHKNIDIDKIISSGAESLLVTDGSYLTSKEQKRLENHGCEVDLVYKMTNTTYIKKNADTIGEMLSESKAIKIDSVEQASRYKTFCNDLIKDCCNAANGGEKELAGDGTKTTYEKKNSTKYTYDNSAKYTLLIDDWDSTAQYSGSIGGWSPKGTGAALSTVGYSTTPVSFYIQAGGLINTAAYKGGSTSGQIIVWQFNSNVAGFAKSKWKNSDGGVDGSLNMGTNQAHGWDKTLLTGDMSASGVDALSETSKNFGTKDFPKAIAATQDIKTKFIDNSGAASEQTIYHPYGVTSDVFGQFFGYYTGKSRVASVIGVDADSGKQIYDNSKGHNAISEDDVIVNPHGLFSSWTEGGSPESFLEAAWVNDVVNGDSDSVGWKTYVTEFYDKFYGYDVSGDLDIIEAGSKN